MPFLTQALFIIATIIEEKVQRSCDNIWEKLFSDRSKNLFQDFMV